MAGGPRREGVAATTTRIALPIYLAFFSAFDSVAGMATGLAVHHANETTGAAHDGAVSTAEYLMSNNIASNMSPIAAVATFALVAAVMGAAMTLRQAGASRAVWGLTLAGLFLNVHAGWPAAFGLAALGSGLVLADRAGLVR